MIQGQDVPRPSTLYCRKAPSRHALSFPLLLFFGLRRFVNVQCCAPLDHACSSAFIVCALLLRSRFIVQQLLLDPGVYFR